MDDDDNPENRGKWKSHIFIQVPIFDNSSLTRLLPWPFKEVEEYHISLSKTFFLTRHEIEPFKEQLTDVLKGFTGFFVRVSDLIMLKSENEDTFAALEVVAGKMQINVLLDRVDEIMNKFGKEIYYSERILHCSIASWPSRIGEPSSQVLQDDEEEVCETSFNVTEIVMRAGHYRFTIPLKCN